MTSIISKLLKSEKVARYEPWFILIVSWSYFL